MNANWSFEYPYKTLQELKANSPSRKHGLSEEQEERWMRAAINLITTAGSQLRIDHLAVVTALEFLHRFYAEFSMVTNDRFLIATACLYLGGKVADTPKSSRDVIAACLDRVCIDKEESRRIWQDREWMDVARERINMAERAILYQLGFRFSWTTPQEHLIRMLGSDPSSPLLPYFIRYFGNDHDRRSRFNQICLHLTNQSSKIPLVLQYPTDAIAAACIWLGMKLLKVDTRPLSALYRGQPWYYKYDLKNTDLDAITEQISKSIVSDTAAAVELAAQATAVRAEIRVPSLYKASLEEVGKAIQPAFDAGDDGEEGELLASIAN